jgi:Mn2+/Fe2+ NRAMP family transporter
MTLAELLSLPPETGGAPSRPGLRARLARHRRRLPLRLKLVVIGLVGVLLNLLVVQAAIAGLNSSDHSRRAIEDLNRAQRHHQDAASLLGTLRGSALAGALLDSGSGASRSSTSSRTSPATPHSCGSAWPSWPASTSARS